MKVVTENISSMAQQTAEKGSKSYIGKPAAGRIRCAIPLLVILLTVSPVPAQAGVIDTINNKVSSILSKVRAIATNTSGLGEFITTLRDIRENLGGGMIGDMQDTLDETRDLIQFIKDRRDSAGQSSQYPSLHVLVESLGDISDALTNRDNQGGALEGLSSLLAVLPDKALAPFAKTVSRVGVDGDFVAKIDQMATNLVELRDILEETAARRESASQVAGDGWVDSDGLLFAEFGCHIRGPAQLVRLSRTARAVKKTAEIMKLFGALIEANTDLVKTEKGIGVWGWISLKVKVNAKETTGKLLGVFGDSALVLVDSAQNIIDTCEEQYMQQVGEAV